MIIGDWRSARMCLVGVALGLACLAGSAGAADVLKPQVEEVASGIWRVRLGMPEEFTPTRFRQRPPMTEAIGQLPKGEKPFPLEDIIGQAQAGRCVVHVPLDKQDGEIFGFGLDPNAFRQKGLMKTLQVSAGPVDKAGYSHGPVPFYVSTKGYGVWVDTARVPVVHVGQLKRKKMAADAAGADAGALKSSVAELYAARPGDASEVVFEIPAAQGADVYVFAGPTVREAVQRYTLFSGGGAMPPLWGLGLKYRLDARFDAARALGFSEMLRRERIPCDMLGLEPGWQSHAYSCSFTWAPDRFPDPKGFIEKVNAQGYKINLWEHAYTHPTSPLYKPLEKLSGDYLVWGGLVPDFAEAQARDIFTDYHEKKFVKEGIAGFKSDECDRQPPTDATPFNFPYCTTFPSGIDAQQYSQLFGEFCQKALGAAFDRNNLRTWSDVRATGSLCAPYPFVLYSDAYDQAQYLRQLLNSTFVGELWSPEVREAGTREEMLNRVAMAAFAHQMCFNMWYIMNPPWMQIDKGKNNAGEFLADHDQLRDRFREIIERRMSLIPYLYASFYEYRQHGVPPLRALPIDYPGDQSAWAAEDEYMFGESMLVAPFVGSKHQRQVYLPEGGWVSWQNGKRYEGKQTVPVELRAGDVPVFVKENSIVPVAKPVQCVGKDTVFEITARVYGDAPKSFTLIEDDGVSLDLERGKLNRVVLAWDNALKQGEAERKGRWNGKRYEIKEWVKVEPQK